MFFKTISNREADFAYERALMPLSGRYGYFFPYDVLEGTFDTKSYNPQDSDNQISKEMISHLMKDVNKATLSKKARPWFLVVAILAVFMTIIVPMILIALKKNFLLLPSISLGCCFIIVWTCCFHCRKLKQVSIQRNEQIKQVLDKHYKTTFKDNDVHLGLSNFGAYISIEFLWRRTGFSQNLHLKSGEFEEKSLFARIPTIQTKPSWGGLETSRPLESQSTRASPVQRPLKAPQKEKNEPFSFTLGLVDDGKNALN